MPPSVQWRLPLVLLVVALSAWCTFPVFDKDVTSPALLEKAERGVLPRSYEAQKDGGTTRIIRRGKIKLGLDLQGGLHLILRVDRAKVPPELRKKDVIAVALEVVRKRMERYIDPTGVREPLIQRRGEDLILIQIPGVSAAEADRLREYLGRPAFLEFKLVSESRYALEQAIDGRVPPDTELLTDREGTPVLVEQEGALTGEIVSETWVDVGDLGFPIVRFKLTTEGSRAFGRLTGANVGRSLAIVLDKAVQSAPQIKSKITGEGIIEGQFDKEEAREIVRVLQSGSLPAPVVPEESRFVGPTLGRDSIRAGLLALAVGAALIIVFMLAYYWLAGVVAIIALALNVLIILGALGFFHGSLTLPGMAGLILTLGMAVDANVLIYERIREELKAGRPLSLAIDTGYDKAFSAILDSNVTTVIAGAILWGVATGPLRGFATTLIAGIVASMFTAIFVTRVMFDVLLGTGRLKRLPMAHLIGVTKINFIKWRYACYLLSAVVLAAGVAAFVQRGPQRYGIDFTGGLLQEYRFSRPINADQLRVTLGKVGLGDAVIQEYGGAQQWLIRTADASEEQRTQTKARTREALLADFGEAASPQFIRGDEVGPIIGEELRRKAWLAIGLAMVGILGYVALRFRHLDFGAAGVIALTHDVMVGVGALCLLQRPIDMTIVAALLTIAGFSINDTIVIYDRVRENLRLHRKLGLAEVINLSVNEMLGRTLLTSLTVIFQVAALLLFSGAVLRDFSICLLAGFVSGVYSTVYIASAIVVSWRQLFQPKQA